MFVGDTSVTTTVAHLDLFAFRADQVAAAPGVP